MKALIIILQYLSVSRVTVGFDIYLRLFDGVFAAVALGVDGALLHGEVAAHAGLAAVVAAAARRAPVGVRARLAHARQAVVRRSLCALNEAVQCLHGLQLRHHLVQEPLWARSRQVQHHAFRLETINTISYID